MNKTKFFSSLLVVALIATTSVFTSCKDYDDDIKNLQTQIDKAALKSELDALQTQLNGVKTTAEKGVADAANALSAAGVAKDAADKAQAAADKAAEAAAKAITDAANAQNTADVAKAAAEAAQLTADAAKALGEAAATKEELEAAKKELAADAKKTADALDALAKAAATKAELNEAVTTLTALAEAAKALAEAAATKTELNEAVQNLTALIDKAATKVELTAAKTELETFAQTAANQAKEAAIKESKAYAEELAGQIEEKIANTLKDYATNEALATLTKNLNNSLDELKKEIMGASDTNVEALAFAVGQYAKQIDVLFCAITSIELVESYSGGPFYQGNTLAYWSEPIYLGFYHGSVSENSVFGDEAYKNADKLIEYKAGDDIKDYNGLIVRVNPVNADLSTADIKLINSKGEDISDIIEVAGVMPLNDYLISTTTRSANMKSGLWAVFFNVADGVTEEAFNEKVIYKDEYEIEREILFAIAANNTVSDNADRYAVSSYDIRPWYGKYEPALSFTFDVNGESVNNIRNRWTGNYIIPEMQVYDPRYPGVPERAWADPTKDYPTPATAPIIKQDGTGNTVIDQNKYYYETRRYPQTLYQFVYADVNEPFVISNIKGYFKSNYNYAQQIDHYYVVFDKENAVESVPSEWNAWNSYEVEGLGVMTDADESLTMKITSQSAHGDVVGFRVYAVNRDGTLADPDGRAFYVFVGKPGDDQKAEAADIIATKAQPESEEMDVTGWFQDGKYYMFTTLNEENENTNPKWYNNGNESDFTNNNVILNFYKTNGSKTTYYLGNGNFIDGSILKDMVKVTFTPNTTIAGMLNDETYTVYIRRYETNVPSAEAYYPYATLSITKKLPTEARNPEFRPKQEGDWDNGKWTTKDGSGKFMAYMIPNTYGWSAPWAYNFNESYEVASSDRSNGFKDLNNIFYNLNDDRDLEFIFQTSLKSGSKNVDLVNANKQGIIYRNPGNSSMPYVLDVAKSYIDAKTEHNVKVLTLYKNVSTYFDEDEKLHYAETHKVAGNDLTAVYACWHHATHDIAWADKKTPTLQWKAEGGDLTSELNDLTTKNSYNNDYFGLTIGKLLDNNWIKYVANSAQLNTKEDGTGQVNPYFKPTVTIGSGTHTVKFTQNSVQVDSNPTADHDEYLIMKFKDAYGHEFTAVTKVPVKKAAAASRMFK